MPACPSRRRTQGAGNRPHETCALLHLLRRSHFCQSSRVAFSFTTAGAMTKVGTAGSTSAASLQLQSVQQRKGLAGAGTQVEPKLKDQTEGLRVIADLLSGQSTTQGCNGRLKLCEPMLLSPAYAVAACPCPEVAWKHTMCLKVQLNLNKNISIPRKTTSKSTTTCKTPLYPYQTYIHIYAYIYIYISL